MPRGEFGNTVQFAAKALADHWFTSHEEGWPGDEGRPYKCETCRALWYRYSAIVKPDQPTPIPYVEVVRLVKSGGETADSSADAPFPSPAP